MAFEEIGLQAAIRGLGPFMQGLNQMSSGVQGFAGKAVDAEKKVLSLRTGILILGGGLLVGAVAALKFAKGFDEAFDTIRVGTGATGKALKSLEGDAKAVFKDTPTSIEAVGTAIADLNARLDLTGKPLQQMAKQFLELSRITKTDLKTNIEATTRVFGDWGISTDRQSKALDTLFRVSQATGPSVADIGRLAVQYGAPLRQLGFSFEEAAVLMGRFMKEGVNTELVMGSLRIAISKFAKDNIPMREGLEKTIKTIRELGPSAASTALAMEIFGARAGADMADTILQGKFAIDEWLASVGSSDETILGAAEATRDWQESLTIFKNRALVALEPSLTKFMGLVTRMMDAFIALPGPLQTVTVGIVALTAAMLALNVVTSGLVMTLGVKLLPVLAAISPYLLVGVGIVAGVIALNAVAERFTGRGILSWLKELIELIPGVSQFLDFLSDTFKALGWGADQAAESLDVVSSRTKEFQHVLKDLEALRVFDDVTLGAVDAVPRIKALQEWIRYTADALLGAGKTAGETFSIMVSGLEDTARAQGLSSEALELFIQREIEVAAELREVAANLDSTAFAADNLGAHFGQVGAIAEEVFKGMRENIQTALSGMAGLQQAAGVGVRAIEILRSKGGDQAAALADELQTAADVAEKIGTPPDILEARLKDIVRMQGAVHGLTEEELEKIGAIDTQTLALGRTGVALGSAGAAVVGITEQTAALREEISGTTRALEAISKHFEEVPEGAAPPESIELAGRTFSRLAAESLIQKLAGGGLQGISGPELEIAQKILAGESGLPGFQQGTAFVPSDMMALLHRGEMIVPAQAASSVRQGFFGSLNVSINIDGAASPTQVAKEVVSSLQQLTRRYSPLAGLT